MNVKLSFGTATAMKAIDFLGWFLVFFRPLQQFDVRKWRTVCGYLFLDINNFGFSICLN